jgi:hypothetical protein
VSFAKALEPWFAEIVEWHGMSCRCAAIQMLDGTFANINDVAEEKERCWSISPTASSPTTAPT